MSQRGHSRRCHGQQGVIGFMHLSVLTLLVLCMVLALDAGRLYYERQNLQRQADLVALETTARAGVVASTEKNLNAVAWESANRNGFASSADGTHGLVVATGRVDLQGAVRQFDPAASRDLHDGVRVQLTRSVPTSIAGNLAALVPGLELPARTKLEASAVARRTVQPAFSVGSTLLTADLGASPLLGPLLAEMLGGDVDVSALGFEGLARARVTLAELVDASADVAALSVDTLEELLDLSVTVTQLAELTLAALQRDDSIIEAEVEALSRLVGVLGSVPAGVLQEGIRLGDLLVIDGLNPETSAHLLGVDIGVAELLDSALFLAHEDNPLRLDLDLAGDDLGGVPGLSSPVTVGLDLTVIEAPQIAIGPAGCEGGGAPSCMGAWRTEARTAQLDMETRLGLELLALVALDLELKLKGAGGAAGIEAIGSRAAGGYELDVAGTGSVLDLDVELDLALLPALEGLLELGVAGGTHSADRIPSASDSGRIIWPDSPSLVLAPSGVNALFSEVGDLLGDLQIDLELGPDADEPASCNWWDLLCQVGSALDTVLGGVLDTVNELLGVVVETVSDLLGGLDEVLDGLTDALLRPLLEPLLEALGIGLVDLQVQVHDVHAGSVELVQ